MPDPASYVLDMNNDVWIAASAAVTGATLMTGDTDFDHLQGTWIDRIWIDPNTGKAP